jgi:P27 family predicted phage terminase small subunit
LGRPAKPEALKRRDGTYRRDRANAKAGEFPPGIPPEPKELKRDGRAEWRRLALILDHAGVLSLADMGALRNYCVLEDVIVGLVRDMSRGKKFLLEEKGSAKKYPLIQELNKAISLQTALAGQLGLTPAARTKASTLGSGTDEQDEAGQLEREAKERRERRPRAQVM